MNAETIIEVDLDTGRKRLRKTFDRIFETFTRWYMAVKRYEEVANTRNETIPLTDEHRQSLLDEIIAEYPDVDLQSGKDRKAPRIWIKGTPGIGKTRELIFLFIRLVRWQLDNDIDIRHIAYYAPDHKLADQFVNDFLSAYNDHYPDDSASDYIFHIRGRGHTNPNDRPRNMCVISKFAHEMHHKGFNVRTDFCEVSEERQAKHGLQQCPYRKGCAYMDQQEDIQFARILVMVHDNLYSTPLTNPTIHLAATDEDFRGRSQVRKYDIRLSENGIGGDKPLIGDTEYDNPDSLFNEYCSKKANEVTDRDALFDILQTLDATRLRLVSTFKGYVNRNGLLKAIRQLDLNRDHLTQYSQYLDYQRDEGVKLHPDDLEKLAGSPNTDPAEYQERGLAMLAHYGDPRISKTSLMFKTVLNELEQSDKHNPDDDNPTPLLRVDYRLKDGKNSLEGDDRFSLRTARWRNTNMSQGTFLVHTDGTGSKFINKLTFGEALETIEIRVKRHLTTTLVTGGNISKSGLLVNSPETHSKIIKMHEYCIKHEVDAVIMPKDIGTKVIELLESHLRTQELPSDEIEAQLNIYRRTVDYRIYSGNLRGANELENVQHLAIWCKTQPPLQEIETTAAAIADKVGERITMTRFTETTEVDGFYRDTRNYANITKTIVTTFDEQHNIRVAQHSNPFCEKERYAVCEVEGTQKIDRIRPVSASPENPKRVTLFGNYTGEIAIDEVKQFRPLMLDSKTFINQVLADTGVFPLSPIVLEQLCKHRVSAAIDNISNTYVKCQKELAKFMKSKPRVINAIDLYCDQYCEKSVQQGDVIIAEASTPNGMTGMVVGLDLTPIKGRKSIGEMFYVLVDNGGDDLSNPDVVARMQYTAVEYVIRHFHAIPTYELDYNFANNFPYAIL